MSSIYDGFDLAGTCTVCMRDYTCGSLPQLRAWMTNHRRDCKAES